MSQKATARPRTIGGSTHAGRRQTACTSSRSVRFDIEPSLGGGMERGLAGLVERQGNSQEVTVVGDVVESGEARGLPDARHLAVQAATVDEAPRGVERGGDEVDEPAVGALLRRRLELRQVGEVAAARRAGG